MPHEVLIVDDEADIRLLIGGVLADEGYETRDAGTSSAALDLLRGRQPAAVLLDIWLEGSDLDGIELLQTIKREWPRVPVIMISGHGTVETAVRALKDGAYDFIEKPFKSERLLLTVARAIEAAQRDREIEELRLRSGGPVALLGDSPAIQQVRHAVERVAPTGSRVFITGPAGSGKEIVARMIHGQSRRADGPFVALNCAIMHPDRLEMELFGTEHPTSDGSRKIGVLEQAHGGTLMLDEIADMPLETQAKIVRVLQEQRFERLGGANRIEVDIRVIALTNRDIEVEMDAGRFRRDLYYRLNVVPIAVPSLAERREDIAVLATHFMTQAAETAGLAPRELGEDALAALQAYEWPGNVRQLRNVIDWLLIMAAGRNGGAIRADMLPPEIGSIAPEVLKWDKGAEMLGMPLREAREVFERDYLLAQVHRFGGNISRTAQFVGMERSALHRKLKALGVHGERASGVEPGKSPLTGGQNG